MENDFNQGQESVYSNKVRAGKRRTYFFDVRKTKSEDFYITLTESTRRFHGTGYNRHKIFLYKEDFNRFVEGLQDAINHVKTELMPDYDYEEFDRRQEEWERQKAEELAAAESATPDTKEEDQDDEGKSEDKDKGKDKDSKSAIETEDDMDW